MLKRLLPFFLFVTTSWIFAQRSYTSFDPADYLPRTVILKVKPAFRNSCSEAGIEHPLYKKAAASLQVNHIEKKFKNEQPPLQETNAVGQALVDLSLIYEVTYTSNTPMEKALSCLMSTGLFQYAEPHIVPKPCYSPNDPLANPTDQYHLQTIHAFNAWSVNKGDSSIVIGITDTGTDTTHNDLFYSIKRNLADPIDMIDNDGDGYVDNYMGWDLGMNDNDPTYQANAHGVHVCGIAGATADNNLGGAGVGFNCKILPVKIGDANGNLIAAYEGIKYAADHGCTAINCSWGSNSGTQYGQDVMNYASINKNTLVVAAAGNNGNSLDFFPAAFDNVFAVANTDASDVAVVSSDYGYFVDVCAPGNNINSTWPGDFYITLTGTSMSSPCVAGAAGIVKNQFPTYTGLQIAERLRVTADNIYASNPSYINKLGSGRINLYRALTDPPSPSIVFSNKVVTDHNDDTFISGDTLFISGRFTNYLASTTALSATLTSLSSYAAALDNTTSLGVINTLNYADNSADPFTFKLSGSIPLNQVIDFRLDIQDGSYQTVAFMSVYLNTDYINITINNVNTTATSLGRIGYNTNGQAQGLGFKYNGTDLLYEAGFMTGNDTSHVSNCVRGSNPSVNDADFSYGNRIVKTIPAVMSDFETNTTFNDNAAYAPQNLDIQQKTYAWTATPNEKFVIWEYLLTNTHATDTLKTLYAGIFADWDIDGSTFAQNRSAYDAATKMGYSYYTANGGKYAGIKLLSTNALPNFYAMDNVGGGNGGIDPTDGYTTKEKYMTLSTSRLAAGVNGSGNDIINVMSTGPFVLNPGQSVKVAFALLGGDSLSDLKAHANQAQIIYNGVATGIGQAESSTVSIYPNPATQRLYVSDPQNMVESYEIRDLSGQLLLGARKQSLSSGIDISSLAEGVYFIRLHGRSGDIVKKFVRLK